MKSVAANIYELFRIKKTLQYYLFYNKMDKTKDIPLDTSEIIGKTIQSKNINEKS